MGAPRAPLCLLAAADGLPFARTVGAELGHPVTPSHDTWFACGEAKHVIEANVRGNDVYVVQQTVVPGSGRSIYDRLMMALHAVDAARCADAARVTLILPYLPGSRQDKRKNWAREGVSTGLFARMFEAAGVDMVLTIEPHNEAVVGCYGRSVFEGISITRAFARFLDAEGLRRDCMASTDVGGLEMARAFAANLRCDLVALSKERDYSRPNTVARSTLLGDVQGRSVMIIDDIIDTAGSVVAAVETLWEHGATDVVVGAAHLILSGPAWDRLHRLRTSAEARGYDFRVVGVSHIQHPEAPAWYHEFQVEPLLAKIIRSVNTRGSVRAAEER
ncbi:MAG: ribose-phosphate diphosphokinase [Myxococcales bacterium]|nr:ribose-phosphate diphosphokinase [Myxococcales bacterium]MCB9670422.1 ribose-phosphate diphosphokinase [Alphaproteobacteria bacterium]